MSFLPGHFPAGAAAGRAKLTTLSFVTSAITNNQTGTGALSITAPAGIQAGDLIIYYDNHVATGTVAASTPSGFTQAVATVVSGITQVISYKIAVGTESGTNITGMSGGTAVMNGIIAVFRGNKAISSISVGSVNQQEADTDPTAQVCAASGGVAPLIVFGAYHVASTGSDINPRTFTVGGVAAKDAEINSNTKNYLAYKVYNSAPADVTIDMADHGTQNLLQSFYLQAA